MTVELIHSADLPEDIQRRVLRIYSDARHLAKTMTSKEACEAFFVLEHARDDLSHVLERGKAR